MPMFTLLDHRDCPPDKHRTEYDRDRGEDGDPQTGQMLCFTCLKPLTFCVEAETRNNADPDGYDRKYFHPDPADAEECPV